MYWEKLVLDNRAHENFDGAGVVAPLAVRGQQVVLELVFRCGLRDIDFVAEDHDRHMLQLVLLKEVGELRAAFVKTGTIRGINQINNSIHALTIMKKIKNIIMGKTIFICN